MKIRIYNTIFCPHMLNKSEPRPNELEVVAEGLLKVLKAIKM